MVTAALVSRARLLIALLSALVTLGLAGQLFAPARADAGPAADLRVGHTIKGIVVNGRNVDVHLWYPADPQRLSDRPKTVYQSTLTPLNQPLLASLPSSWAPHWSVEAEVAREDAPIDPHGPAFPVIVFSHGSNNDPIDYAYTLEELAGAGFVVAAPYHVNNTQDDVRIDDINSLVDHFNSIGGQPPLPHLPCNNGLPGPCSPLSTANNVRNNMRDRVSDISWIIGARALPGWFGDRVDMTRVGVMGHSRGTVTALTAAGGSAGWDIDPLCRVVAADGNCREPAVKAVMGLAIGGANVTNMVNLAKVTAPALLVAGGLDKNSDESISEHAFETISSADKLFVSIPNAVHRSFDSTYCAELQSAAANVNIDPNAILDRNTVGLIAASAPGGVSGKAVHYCAPQYFTSPENIQQVVASSPNSEYFCPNTENPAPGNLDPACYLIQPTSGPTTCPTNTAGTNTIPCTGLDTDEVKQGIVKIAVAFFDSTLKRTDNDGIDFKRYLAPKWLMEHVPMVGSAKAYAGRASICPPGQGVICAK
jgi:predicted dienelactone hydrolase